MTRGASGNLLILADDLTGALDTGVKFAREGVAARVFLSTEGTRGKEETETAPVTVINTNSRHLAPEEAKKAVAEAVRRHGDAAFFYKKTDSCLRGNIGAELEALLEATGGTRLAFAPAYPDLKRTTRDGIQLLEGTPLDQTAMANDLLNPVTESFIPRIINKQSSLPVRLVRRGRRAGEAGSGREILVFDAETNGDLRRVARDLARENLLGLSAGCAGFANALLDALPLPRNADATAEIIPPLPVLVLSGSVHPVSVNQVKAGLEHYAGFGFRGEEAVRPGWLFGEAARDTAAASAKALREKGVCILGTAAALGETISAEENREGLSVEKLLPGVFGGLARRILSETGPLHLVVFGGDTLRGVAEALQYNCLWPKEEIRPGIVISGTGVPGCSAYLVTKAGAFGEENLISVITEFLNRRR